MDILKRASHRSSPKIVALQIKKYAPRNHPKTKKYLKLLSSFGQQWFSHTPIPPEERALYEEILSISACSSQQHSPAGQALKDQIKFAKKLIQDEQGKTDCDPQTLAHLEERLHILNLMKNRDPYFLAHVNFQVLGGGGNFSPAHSRSTLLSPNQGFTGTIYLPPPPPPAAIHRVGKVFDAAALKGFM